MARALSACQLSHGRQMTHSASIGTHRREHLLLRHHDLRTSGLRRRRSSKGRSWRPRSRRQAFAISLHTWVSGTSVPQRKADHRRFPVKPPRAGQGRDPRTVGSARSGAGPDAKELISLRLQSNKLAVLPALSAFRVLQHLVSSYLGMGVLNRLHRYIYDCAYGLPQWREISTFNYGYAPSDASVAEVWPNEPYQIQLYAEVAKALRTMEGRTAPSRLLEVCCGRGGGLAHLHATLSPEATIGIDRSLAAIRHGRNRNAAIAHLQGDALQLPLSEASIDLAVNVEALADVPKLPFLAEIYRVLTENGIFAVADTMPHGPEACHLALIGLGQKTDLRVVYFRDITVNVCEACRNDDRRRSQLINRLPRYLRPIAREWVSLPGSTRFGEFDRKERCYFIALMMKKTARPQPQGINSTP